jgi:23S rRNA (guanosine2251-2'-O)-methyltransferase
MSVFIILNNIRSAHNIGSVFRTADGAGVSKIYLGGYTPAPTDRFGREQKEVLKTSLGATHTVPYELVEDICACIEKLKSEGVSIVAVEQTKDAVDYETFVPEKDTAYIFGNEITGVEASVLALADHHISIPMKGSKESLNVSVCAGIILFKFR